MTITEIAERVAERLGSPFDLTWGFVQETIQELVDVLNKGEEVKIRGLGRLYWAKVEQKTITMPAGNQIIRHGGWKLKFAPAKQFKTRRYSDAEREGQRRGDDEVCGGDG